MDGYENDIEGGALDGGAAESDGDLKEAMDGVDGGGDESSAKPSLKDMHDADAAEYKDDHPEATDQSIRDNEALEEKQFSQAMNPEMQKLRQESDRDQRLSDAQDGMSDESKDTLGEWDKAAPEQKTEALQDYSDQLSNEFDTESSPSVNCDSFGEGAENEAGYYNPSDQSIHVNSDCPENATPEGAMNTVGHEFEHYRQEMEGAENPSPDVQVSNPEAFEKYGEQVDSDGRLSTGEYITPDEDYDSYRAQPLEDDAFDMGDRAEQQAQELTDEELRRRMEGF